MSHWGTVRITLAVMCVALGLAFMWPHAASAQAASPAPVATPSAPETPGATASLCSKYPGLTNRLASCIRDSVDGATEEFFTGFYPLISKAIAAFITLGVIIFGIMSLSGMIEQPGKDSIMFLLKIAMIGYFTTNVDVMHKEVVAAMDSVGAAVVSYTPGAGVADSAGTDFSRSTCLKNMRSATQANGSAENGPWLGVDCLIDSVIGIKVTNIGSAAVTGEAAHQWYNENLDPTKPGLTRGFLFLFSSGMTSSIMGAIFAAIGLLFIYGLVFLIAKVLLMYLAAYIGIVLLMIVSPLFIPLVLMRETRSYFDKWTKLVINFALQPIIMLVFIIFIITGVDFAAFSGDYSLAYRVAGNASRQPNFNLNEYLTSKAVLTPKKSTLAQVKAQTEGGGKGSCGEGNTLVNGLCESECVQAVLDPKLPSYNKTVADRCAQAYDILWVHNNIDWKKLAELRNAVGPAVVPEGDAQPGEQIAREALSAVIFLGAVVFVLNHLVRVIPSIAVDLVGDLNQSPNLARYYGSSGSNAITSATKNVRQAISSTITGRGGAS